VEASRYWSALWWTVHVLAVFYPMMAAAHGLIRHWGRLYRQAINQARHPTLG